MPSRRKPHARCDDCLMRKELCICKEISACRNSLQLRTKIFILMHHRERKLTTNTARLASLAIPNCEIRIRGLENVALDTSGIVSEQAQTLLLYPTEDAEVLNAEYMEKITKPIHLIVPDGSWRQAAKVSKRESFLAEIPRVSLPAELPSQYKLRSEPKEGGLATFEAIARALGFIENKETQKKLEELFHLMVSRTLNSRNGINYLV